MFSGDCVACVGGCKWEREWGSGRVGAVGVDESSTEDSSSIQAYLEILAKGITTCIVTCTRTVVYMYVYMYMYM